MHKLSDGTIATLSSRPDRKMELVIPTQSVTHQQHELMAIDISNKFGMVESIVQDQIDRSNATNLLVIERNESDKIIKSYDKLLNEISAEYGIDINELADRRKNYEAEMNKIKIREDELLNLTRNYNKYTQAKASFYNNYLQFVTNHNINHTNITEYVKNNFLVQEFDNLDKWMMK